MTFEFIAPGEGTEPELEIGPIFPHRAAMPAGIVLAGHSSLMPSGGPTLGAIGHWISAMPVWLTPGDRYVQELIAHGMMRAEVIPDGVHLNDANGVARDAEWQGAVFITGQLHAGAVGIIAEAGLASIQTHFRAGLGGTEFGGALDIADPLPSPGQGEPEGPDLPANLLFWTPVSDTGPALRARNRLSRAAS